MAALRPELLGYRVQDQVATITLSSPRNRNALSKSLLRELLAALSLAQDDDGIRAIVIGHDGPAFSSGGDLAELREDNNDDGLELLRQLLRMIWDLPKPVLAKVSGAARAGGIGIIAACDIAVASSNASFAFTETRIGSVPALISAPVMRRMNPREAQRLMLTGEVFTADVAREAGLLTDCVQTDELDGAVQRLVQQLTLGAPEAVAGAKRLLHMDRATDFAADLGAMLPISRGFFGSDEAREGMDAFLDKRRPYWQRDPGLTAGAVQ